MEHDLKCARCCHVMQEEDVAFKEKNRWHCDHRKTMGSMRVQALGFILVKHPTESNRHLCLLCQESEDFQCFQEGQSFYEAL